MKSTMIVYKNINLYDFKTFTENAFIAFNTKILKVGSMADYQKYIAACTDYTEIDGNGGFILPGLVLAHTHIYSTFARGWITPFNPHSFQDILDQQWWKLDKQMGQEEIYYSGITSGESYIKNGITTIIDHHASGQMISGSLRTLKKAIVDKIGLRGIFCFETSDRFDVKECIAENVSFYEEMAKAESADARGLLGLHASFSLSDDSLNKLSQTPSTIPLHVHVGESIEDVEWTKEHAHSTILERFNKFNLLRKDSIYVHGVHLEDKDFDLIKETDGIMAFNPSSNMNNGVGLPQVDKVTQVGIPFMVGNDGLGFGLARDYQTMIFSSNLHGPNHFNLQDLQRSIVTSYKYASKQFGCLLGELQEGYEADLMLVPYHSITPMTAKNAFGHFAYGILDQLHPKDVYAKGRCRVSEYRLVENISDDLCKAKKCAAALWNKLQ